jgi:hypothetical protein
LYPDAAASKTRELGKWLRYVDEGKPIPKPAVLYVSKCGVCSEFSSPEVYNEITSRHQKTA